MRRATIICGDALAVLRAMPSESVHCCVTSPPYWNLRDYGVTGQLGLERSPAEYIERLVEVFAEVRRVLRRDGVLFLNMGDSYASKARGSDQGWDKCRLSNPGSLQKRQAAALRETGERHRGKGAGFKNKDLIGMPWRLAFALQDTGWYLRRDIIWCLSGGARVYARTQKGEMPMSIKDLVRLDPSTVELWNGEKWTQVLGWSRSPGPRDGALELELRSGERIGCTSGHEWPTQRGNVRTDALIVGDIINTTVLPEPEEPVFAEALDNEVAWLCGLYLADGSMSGETAQFAGHTSEIAGRLERLEPIAKRFHGTIRAHTSSEDSATICMDGPLIASLIQAYIYGDSAAVKGLKSRTWQRGNAFLLALLEGYLAGDGHYDAENDRWRLGFTRNDRLAGDLRTLAARLGLSMRLAIRTVRGFGRQWPAYGGDIRLTPTHYRSARNDGEVIAVRAGRGRAFWDISVADEPHLFALASGVLTHNSKPNPMPESVTDRPTTAHEYVFLLSKSARYFYDAEAVREADNGSDHPRHVLSQPEPSGGILPSHRGIRSGPGRQGAGRNLRSVWTIPTSPFPGAHFATFPLELARRCIAAGTSERGCCPGCGAPWKREIDVSYEKVSGCTYSRMKEGSPTDPRSGALPKMRRSTETLGWRRTCPCKGDPSPAPCVVLDPFSGAGTTAMVALRMGRQAIGIDLKPEYCEMTVRRIERDAPLLNEVVLVGCGGDGAAPDLADAQGAPCPAP